MGILEAIPPLDNTFRRVNGSGRSPQGTELVAVGDAHGSNGEFNCDPKGVEPLLDPFQGQVLCGIYPVGAAHGY